MTQHEQTIRAHCAEHGIQIREYPSGTIRFIAQGVDVSYADWRHATTDSLAPHHPKRRRLAKQEYDPLHARGALAFDGRAMGTGKSPSRS
nr:hypothetical protein [Rhodoferax sp.]